LGDFLPQLKKQLEGSEVRFNNFRNQNGTFDLGTEGKNYLDAAVKLQASLLELRQNREQRATTAAHPVIQTLIQIAAVAKESQA
jgi:tyrosine-protein kinase Etk/Wzc